ncbi:hypothetical protein [uncultured Celeribacter sp.]|uniref:hypothetical protein n=1 Tax=uncultured Celeribacter sp. TaxID=1303376 RepID=UPI002AA913D8|nr:hypothetical protein [uncultured Celeribacter sp.]
MTKKPFYQESTWTLAPGQSHNVPRRSDFLSCLEATKPFKVQIGEAPETGFQKGLTYTSEADFDSVRIINPTDETIIVTLGFGRGGVRDGRFAALGAIETREKLQMRPFDIGGVISGADGIEYINNMAFISSTVEQVMPIDDMRQKAIFRNASETSAIYFYATTGARVSKYATVVAQPGQTVEILGGAAVYANSEEPTALAFADEVVHV